MPWPDSLRWRLSAQQFQPFNHTKPDRYPWLFSYARWILPPASNILSFGCSTGEELLSLHQYLPDASIKGVDINPRNIDIARERSSAIRSVDVACAGTLESEHDASYDAIFCLATLCDGRLTARACERSSPLFCFDKFESAVNDLARCIKPGGFLFLLTTNFRFCDTRASRDFELALSAEVENLASDLIYDRNNQLMPGMRYRDAVFRKREW
jgi:SAM-dependent methyltransferase